MKNIAIIGGSGYIGSHLVAYLKSYFDVTVINKSNNSFAPIDTKVSYTTFAECTQTFDAIINTAYYLNTDIQKCLNENEILCKNIARISTKETHVIHLSSLAVFGFQLDKPICAEPIDNSTDFAYVQSKTDMENRLLKNFSNNQLSIIRLGNVIGPANNSWTQPIADAITWQLPVQCSSFAYSNSTYIHNISNYIFTVLQSRQHLLIHHLAEFSNYDWKVVIQSIANIINRTPLKISAIPAYPKSLLEECAEPFKLNIELNPIKVLKRLKNGRFTPPILHTLFSLIQKRIKVIPYQPNRKVPFVVDPVFYWVLTSQVEFKNNVLNDWKAPYSFDEAMESIQNWLVEAGYKNEQP